MWVHVLPVTKLHFATKMEELGKFESLVILKQFPVCCPKRERDIDKKLDQLIKVSATNVTIKTKKTMN